MNKEKTKIVLLQCAVCSLFPLLALLLPYLKITIAVAFLGEKSASLTGSDLLRGMSNLNKLAGSELAEYIEDLGTGSTIIIAMIALFFLLPLLLFIASAIWHGIACVKEQKINKFMSALPFGAVILSGGGLILINLFIKMGKDSVSASGTLVADIGSSLAGLVADAIEIKVSGQAGFWIFVLTGLLIGAEDIIFSMMQAKEKQLEFVQDAIYRTKNHTGQKQHPINTGNMPQAFQKPVYTRNSFEQKADKSKGVNDSEWITGNPTLHSKAMSGMLIGLRGEYKGAQIPLKNRELLYIGRSKECNLVLSNAKASRKHCKVIYDAKADKYLIKNYSDNGVFLSTGQRLEKGKAWNVPHGTVFRITKEDEFRLL